MQVGGRQLHLERSQFVFHQNLIVIISSSSFFHHHHHHYCQRCHHHSSFILCISTQSSSSSLSLFCLSPSPNAMLVPAANPHQSKQALYFVVSGHVGWWVVSKRTHRWLSSSLLDRTSGWVLNNIQWIYWRQKKEKSKQTVYFYGHVTWGYFGKEHIDGAILHYRDINLHFFAVDILIYWCTKIAWRSGSFKVREVLKTVKSDFIQIMLQRKTIKSAVAVNIVLCYLQGTLKPCVDVLTSTVVWTGF